jgi:hypothetical protein
VIAASFLALELWATDSPLGRHRGVWVALLVLLVSVCLRDEPCVCVCASKSVYVCACVRVCVRVALLVLLVSVYLRDAPCVCVCASKSVFFCE